MFSWSAIHLLEVEQTDVLEFCTILVKFLLQCKSYWSKEFIVLKNTIVNLASFICFYNRCNYGLNVYFTPKFKS